MTMLCLISLTEFLSQECLRKCNSRHEAEILMFNIIRSIKVCLNEKAHLFSPPK